MPPTGGWGLGPFYLVFTWTPFGPEIIVFARFYKGFQHFQGLLRPPCQPAQPALHPGCQAFIFHRDACNLSEFILFTLFTLFVLFDLFLPWPAPFRPWRPRPAGIYFSPGNTGFIGIYLFYFIYFIYF